MSSKSIVFLRIMLALVVAIGATGSAFAGTYKVLYNFTGGSDGQFPNAGVVFDRSGNLFGTTQQGGTGGYGGVIFELSPNSTGGWTETSLHTFGQDSVTDGYFANGSLVFDAAGNLYGTTSSGGLHGAGTVYELSPTAEGGWTYSTIHSFGAGNDGGGPKTGVVVDGAGNLYGTTYGGGVHGGGIAYRLSPGNGGVWNESILHSFPSSSKDGSFPSTGLAFDASGKLYGATNFGDSGAVVFRLSQSSGAWVETILHRFPANKDDGIDPYGTLVLDSGGNIYGATVQGPMGHTSTCGPNFGCGTIFKLAPGPGIGWTETQRYDLPRVAFVVGLTIDGAGNLFATEQLGNRIIELSPVVGGGWTQKSLYNFTGGVDGKLPHGNVTLDSAGNLYGTAFGGGQDGAGVVFDITP